MADDYPAMDVGALHLLVAADADEELVYRVAKTLFESQGEVVTRHAVVGRSITAQDVVRDTGTPFHPGAIRFYREAAIWPEPAEEG